MTTKSEEANEKTSSNAEPVSIKFLCFDFSHLSRNFQFLILTFLTFVFYILYGYMAELMYKLPGFGDHPWFLTLVQFSFYTFFAYIETRARNKTERT